jgi:FAD/FMN-containing dehydrogenase
MPTIFNWATTYSCEPREVLSPRDDEAVVAILRRAKQDGLKVRVIGARHTPGDLFCVDDGGLLLKTDELDKVYHVDEAAATVEVGAGMRLCECVLCDSFLPFIG